MLREEVMAGEVSEGFREGLVIAEHFEGEDVVVSASAPIFAAVVPN